MPIPEWINNWIQKLDDDIEKTQEEKEENLTHEEFLNQILEEHNRSFARMLNNETQRIFSDDLGIEYDNPNSLTNEANEIVLELDPNTISWFLSNVSLPWKIKIKNISTGEIKEIPGENYVLSENEVLIIIREGEQIS